MGSAAALLVKAAVVISLDFFDFVFFGHALPSVAIGVPLSGFAIKLSALRTARLRPSSGASSANRSETLADAVGVNRAELGRGPCRRGKAVFHGELGLKHLVDPFGIGRVVNVASQ